MSIYKVMVFVCVIAFIGGFTTSFLLKKYQSNINSISIDHIDRDGTVWVKIDKNEYYLYIDDNGTQKSLEMK